MQTITIGTYFIEHRKIKDTQKIIPHIKKKKRFWQDTTPAAGPESK